ncbi:hypothetical protein PS467_29815 [Streptomyces luomodiensis]|uniref:AG1 protein n=1 Tax=Streptomyces luomodiensis TaxID=3026192 RepID=A0ABY9V2V4_9ACTN|nr:hypothetical protein [Streptomyces sp. SCA4-21]WNE99230.1 hypothetical protein PS467_29815 [Streptomyces sp. SCA4-21]
MTFGEEWDALRSQAAARQKVRMQLDHVGGGGTSSAAGKADLSVHADDLGAIGHEAYKLYNRVKADGDQARVSSSDAATQLTRDNFTTGSALTKVVDTWGTQLKTLMQACAHISNHLDYSAASSRENDEEIATNMRNADGKSMSVSLIDKYFS